MSNSIPQRQHTVKLEAEKETTSVDIPSHTPAGEAFTALVLQILRLNGLLLSAGDALAEPAGQTSARWRVLAAVEAKPLSVAQIARRWGLARQSVQRVADVLVGEGLAVYEENPKHRRAQLMALTPEGRATLHKIQLAQREWANALGAEIGESELRQAGAFLERLFKVLTG